MNIDSLYEKLHIVNDQLSVLNASMDENEKRISWAEKSNNIFHAATVKMELQNQMMQFSDLVRKRICIQKLISEERAKKAKLFHSHINQQ